MTTGTDDREPHGSPDRNPEPAAEPIKVSTLYRLFRISSTAGRTAVYVVVAKDGRAAMAIAEEFDAELRRETMDLVFMGYARPDATPEVILSFVLVPQEEGGPQVMDGGDGEWFDGRSCKIK